MKTLRVCIDARMSPARSGGLCEFVRGLAHGLSELDSGDEVYAFLVNRRRSAWIARHVRGPLRVLPARRLRWHDLVPESVQFMLARLVSRYRRPPGRASDAAWMLPPRSDRTVELAEMDVVHFTQQWGFETSVPSIYHPHDLQHIHLPEFFTAHERRLRDSVYRALCDQAAIVSVATVWARDDLKAQFGVPDDKLQVVRLAPAAWDLPVEGPRSGTTGPNAVDTNDFVLYPAQTWKHKNHLRLLDALARLRSSRGLEVPLVCTGHRNDFYGEIRRHKALLGLDSQVSFPGFVSSRDLAEYYRACRFVCFPSLFEGGGLPILEAGRAGKAIACSDATCLPEQMGDAALIFDPLDVDSIARAIERMWTDAELRRALGEGARRRFSGLSWLRTARQFRALYRKVGGRRLSDEDRDLLREDPLLDR